VKMDVEIQRTAEALDQRDRTGVSGLPGETGLQEMGNNSLQTKQLAQLQPIVQPGGKLESEEEVEGPWNVLIEKKKKLSHDIFHTRYKAAHAKNNDEKNGWNDLLSQFQDKLDKVNNKIEEMRESSK
jgi:hypothetical protein